MKISLNWLKDWIEFTETDPQILSDQLTDSSSEVEELILQGKGLEKVFVGLIKDIQPHPDADRMQVTQTQVGDETFQIVCGAKNIKVGQKVPVAVVGAVLPGNFEIKQADKRGVESNGMICSEVELGVADTSEGIMVLPEDAPLGMPIIEYLGLNDVILDIENTTITNRPDLFSQLGFAREFTALGLAKWKTNVVIPVKAGIPSSSGNSEANQEPPKSPLSGGLDKVFPLNLTVADASIAPRVCGINITNFEVKQSPEWMKKRLTACGIRPINNLVDITNYVMLEQGMPLHAFDLDSISGKNVVMRLSKEGEKVTTLDGEKRELPANVIIMEDEEKIFDLCGIMGGENSEVKDTTTNVWLHAPVYHSTLIRRASIALNHRTDASVIYEKRVPSGSAILGLNRAVELMKELSPNCVIESQIIDIDNDAEKARSLNLTKAKLSKVFGETPSDEFVENALKNLGFGVTTTANAYQVEVPTFRFKDIEIEEDLIEEVIRIYGLESIESELPKIKMEQAEPVQGYNLELKTKNFLAESAFEVLNFGFFGEKLLGKCFETKSENMIEVANPISADLAIMRTTLVPYLLQNIELNQKQQSKFAVFEIAKVYSREGLKKHEEKHLAYAAFGNDFFETKAVLTQLFEKLGLVIKIQETQTAHSQAHPGQVAQLFFQGKVIGYLATLHPKVVKNFGFEKAVTFFECNFEAVQNAKMKPVQFTAINKLPHAERDQNFILDAKTLVEEFVNKLSKADKLIVDLQVVDIYQGEHVEAGKKSVTVRAVYQANDHTLTDAEVEGVHKQLVAKAEQLGASVR